MFFPIRKKLILIFLVIIIVPTTLSAAVSMWLTLTRLEQGLRTRSRQAMADLKKELQAYEARSENIAELLAGSSEIKRFDHPDEIREFLESKKDLWYTAIVEVFDSRKRLMALSHTESGSVAAYLTRSTDPILDRGLGLEKVSDYFLYPRGLALKSMEPIMDMSTLELLGIVVVTYPFNDRLMQAFKDRIKSEVTLQWNVTGDIVSSIHRADGTPLGKIWSGAATDSRCFGTIETRSREQVAGKNYTVSYEGFKNQFGTTIGIFTTLVDEIILSQNRSDTLRILLVSAMLVFLMALAVGYFTAGSFTRPILELTRVAKHLARGQWDQPLPVDRTDEIGVLARGFARMRDAIQHQIHDLQQMNHAIRKAEEKYRSIFENAGEGIFQVTPRGEIITINTAFATILGFESCGALQKAVENTKLFFVDPQTLQTIQQLLDTLDRVQNFETQFHHRDGTIREISINVHAVKEDGEAIYYEGNIQDITQQKQVHAYKQAMDVAQEANRAKSEFLATITHELRTPLNAILGFSDVLKQNQAVFSREKEAIEIIHRSGHHLLTLINQLLILSAGEAGRLTLEEETVNLHGLLDEVRAMLELSASKKGIRLVFNRDGSVPRMVRVDQMKLRQVLINLVNNAVKFTPQGEVTLRVRSESVHEKNAGIQRLFFEVADTGIGISPEYLQTIFHPFEQLAAWGTGKEGSGLGLTISEKFIRLLGGDISVDSTMGQGTCFSFDIEVRVVDAHETDMAGGAMAVSPDPAVYDKETEDHDGPGRKGSDWRSRAADLPSLLRENMADAVQRADMTMIDRMILQVEWEDSGLAMELRALAQGFEYGKLLWILGKGETR